MKKFQARQGDVFIEKIGSLPKGVQKFPRKNGRIILAEGEVTGHAHAIADESVVSFIDAEGSLFLQVETETEVIHEEHATITLPPGIYKVVHQREYSPQEIRRVQD